MITIITNYNIGRPNINDISGLIEYTEEELLNARVPNQRHYHIRDVTANGVGPS